VIVDNETDVVVFMHGMLYDVLNRPKNCVLTNIQDRIGTQALALFPSLAERSENVLIELPLIDRVSRVEEMIVDRVGDIQQPRLHIVAHSIGAVAASNFVMNTNKAIESLTLLAPPSPLENISIQTSECLAGMLPTIGRDSTIMATLYGTREGGTIRVEDTTIQELSVEQDTLRAALSGEFCDTIIGLPRGDRAFPLAQRDIAHTGANEIIYLNDSHSIKTEESLRMISGAILLRLGRT